MISFIATTYNVNKYLDDFFISFRGINRKFEIIIIDDFSDCEPTEIINKYAKEFNIKYFRNSSNQGIGFSRNLGMKRISKDSSHFMFIDPDDVILSQNFNKINFKDVNKVIASKYEIIWRPSGEKKIVINPWNHSTLFSSVNVIFPVEISFSFIFTGKSFEDFVFMRNITDKFGVKIINYPINKYRIRSSSITNTISKENLENFFDEILNNSNPERFTTGIDKDIYKKILIKYLYITKISEWNLHKEKIEFYKKIQKQNAHLIKGIVIAQKIVRFWWFNSLIKNNDRFL